MLDPIQGVAGDVTNMLSWLTPRDVASLRSWYLHACEA